MIAEKIFKIIQETLNTTVNITLETNPMNGMLWDINTVNNIVALVKNKTE